MNGKMLVVSKNIPFKNIILTGKGVARVRNGSVRLDRVPIEQAHKQGVSNVTAPTVDVFAGRFATNETQAITFSDVPDAGTWTISFKGKTTSALAQNASAAAVQTALDALGVYTAGDVVVSGSMAAGFQLAFQNKLAAVHIDPVTVASSLTKSSAAVSAAVVIVTDGTPDLDAPQLDLNGVYQVETLPNGNPITRTIGGVTFMTLKKVEWARNAGV